MSITVELPELLANFNLPEKCTLDDVAGLFAYIQEANAVVNVEKKMTFIPKLDIQGLIPISKRKLGCHDNLSEFIDIERVNHLTGEYQYCFMGLRDNKLRDYRVPTTNYAMYPGERETHLAIYDFVLDNPSVLDEF